MTRFKKIGVYLFFCVFLLSIFFNYRYYQTIKEEEQQFAYLFTDFYYEVDETIDSLEFLLTHDPEGNKLIDSMVSFLNQLTRIDFMLRRVPYYFFSEGGVSNSVGAAANYIERGTKHKGQFIPPFLEDGRLNGQERAFLQELNSFLLQVQYALNGLEKRSDVPIRDLDKVRFDRVLTENVYNEIYHYRFLEAYVKEGKESN
ncbi:hypothetical protein CAI16_06920 [Virgibacillus dokdonensis]|uniref:Uncharacterized protein n=1 Tax=Virgibacillus dokdonensis TaxID=302167 RepID=A0A3E0WS33_9BACI|nr:hypothetical protein [Virgibacillus dokdonensis]RFA35782.1 hypothetical protein CAI16_06920 [Virgibacillus dokdonensis]